MVFQTDLRLKGYIRDEGCALLATLFCVRQDWTAEQVNSLYDKLVELNIIKKDCFINNWSDLFVHLKDIKEDSTKYSYRLQKWTYYNKVRKKQFYHYVVRDRDGRLLYDPIPNSNTLRYGRCIEEKLIEVL